MVKPATKTVIAIAIEIETETEARGITVDAATTTGMIERRASEIGGGTGRGREIVTIEADVTGRDRGRGNEIDSQIEEGTIGVVASEITEKSTERGTGEERLRKKKKKKKSNARMRVWN